MIKAAIIGVTGYTGIELLRLLQQHPNVAVTNVFTESYAGQAIAEVFPHLQKIISLMGEKLNLDIIIQDCDLVFIALPHGQAKNIVPTLLAAGKKIIDLGADFRLKNSADYQHWYQHEPAAENLLQQAVYGLPEKGAKDSLKNSSLIANPGCYATAAILATLPALKAGIIEKNSCIFDAKSGISGAGRSLALQSHYCEVAENLTPYQLGGLHRHTPEIEQELGIVANDPVIIQFTPHLIPMLRGLLVTAYFKLNDLISLDAIKQLYQEFYVKDFFIRICDKVPNVKQVKGSNYCDIGFSVDTRTRRLIVISVIDNLIKGAAGQAIQNMNLMYQLPEHLGLEQISIYP